MPKRPKPEVAYKEMSELSALLAYLTCNSDLNASYNFLRRAKSLAIALRLSVNKPIVANNEGNDFHSNTSPKFSDKPRL